jgi:hypothetical protein
MNREEILRRIGELDREINEELATVRVSDAPKQRGFPWMNWLLAAALLAWTRAGHLVPDLHEVYARTATYAFYGAIVLGLLALGRTAFWLASGRHSNAYTEMTRTVQKMREERYQLQMELRQLDERGG